MIDFVVRAIRWGEISGRKNEYAAYSQNAYRKLYNATLVRFRHPITLLLRYAHKRIVKIIKVYIDCTTCN